MSGKVVLERRTSAEIAAETEKWGDRSSTISVTSCCLYDGSEYRRECMEQFHNPEGDFDGTDHVLHWYGIVRARSTAW